MTQYIKWGADFKHYMYIFSIYLFSVINWNCILKGYWTDNGEYWYELAVKMHEIASKF